MESANTLIDNSWWVGSIRHQDKAAGLLGLLHQGGARHLVWLASTPALFAHPSSLVRTARQWLRQIQSLGIEVATLAPPIYPKVPRMLESFGFEYQEDFLDHGFYILR